MLKICLTNSVMYDIYMHICMTYYVEIHRLSKYSMRTTIYRKFVVFYLLCSLCLYTMSLKLYIYLGIPAE